MYFVSCFRCSQFLFFKTCTRGGGTDGGQFPPFLDMGEAINLKASPIFTQNGVKLYQMRLPNYKNVRRGFAPDPTGGAYSAPQTP